MAEEVDVPGLGGENKQVVIAVVGAGGLYLAYRWWKNRAASSAAAAAGPAPLPVDTSNTAADQSGNIGYSNPAPGGASGAYSSNDGSSAPSDNAGWSQKVVGDLSNLGYDEQAVATALGLYLAGQPLTPDQQAIIRTAWGYDGKPPQSSNLAIIPAQNPPSGGSTPPPPPPGGGSSTPPPPPPPPPPAPAPDPHAGQHWQDPQVATLMPGVSLRKWQSWNPHNDMATLIALNPGLDPNQSNHPRMEIRTSNGRWVNN